MEAAGRSYAETARVLTEWGFPPQDPTQIKRWVAHIGERLIGQQQDEQLDFKLGRPVPAPANAPELLLVAVDGGRVHTTEVNPETGSRWREDKVACVASVRPGRDGEKPKPLVQTYVATMDKSEPFGEGVRLEAEKRGARRAEQVIVMGDGADWIDSLALREFPGAVRIVDWFHTVEHLHECRRALYPDGSRSGEAFVERLEEHLWEGDVEAVERTLRKRAEALPIPPDDAGPSHPRRVLERNAEYLRKRAESMRYADYRARGWPIGSGLVESAVKRFNKRVKGTEMSWTIAGVEPILRLRALWLSEDSRWDRHWRTQPAYHRCAA